MLGGDTGLCIDMCVEFFSLGEHRGNSHKQSRKLTQPPSNRIVIFVTPTEPKKTKRAITLSQQNGLPPTHNRCSIRVASDFKAKRDGIGARGGEQAGACRHVYKRRCGNPRSGHQANTATRSAARDTVYRCIREREIANANVLIPTWLVSNVLYGIRQLFI